MCPGDELEQRKEQTATTAAVKRSGRFQTEDIDRSKVMPCENLNQVRVSSPKTAIDSKVRAVPNDLVVSPGSRFAYLSQIPRTEEIFSPSQEKIRYSTLLSG